MLLAPETVLLVDDDKAVRGFVSRILTEEGYQVLEAGDGEEALELAFAAGQIDLLLTDVIMPKLNGFALAKRLVQARPKLAVLYMSGYMESSMLSARDSKAVLLQKPFKSDQLIRAVRRSIAPEL